MSTQNDPEFLAKKESEENLAQENSTKRTQAILTWAMIAAAIIVIGVIIYIFFVREPGKQAGNNAIGKADMAMTMNQDSIALAQYKAVADDYSYDAGNRANLNAAIILYRQAQADTSLRKTLLPEAIKYLENYDPQESVIGASSRSLMGDCYVNLGQYDKARKCFAEAVKISDKNPSLTPFFMLKEATVDRALGDYAAELELYRNIKKNYSNYCANQGIDIEKYIARAEASIEKK